MALSLCRCRTTPAIRALSSAFPVASTSKLVHGSPLSLARSGKLPATDRKEGNDLEDQQEQPDFDLSDLASQARKIRATATPTRAQTGGREADSTEEQSRRFKSVHDQITDHFADKSKSAASLKRALVNELLSLAMTRAQLQQVFEICTHLRSRALPVERFYAHDFYDRCIRYDAPRVALKALAEAQQSGLVLPTMTHLWGILERLRVSIDTEDPDDCSKALKSAFRIILQLGTSHLTAADPMLSTQMMAICLRIGSDDAQKLLIGLDKDLRQIVTPSMFARSYYETRRLHLMEVPIFLDRSLTAVREHFQPLMASRDVDGVGYWIDTFELIDEIRRSGNPPPSITEVFVRPGRVQQLGVARGKYGGPVRKNVPYGTPLHRIATVKGQPVTDPHTLDVLARSMKWNHGPRSDPQSL